MALIIALTLGAAALLQLLAAVLALRAMPDGGRYRYPWIALSLALLLMIERRVEPLLRMQDSTRDLLDALYAFAISALVVFGILGLRRLLRALREHEDELLRLATTDHLTGLATRRHALAELERELLRCDRTGKPLSILMVDVDRFKEVNDRHGHAVGDAVLAEVAARCRSGLRSIDLCGRLGGEEFVVVLPGSDEQGAVVTARRLCANLSDTPIETEDGPLSVTISIGVASYEPGGNGERLPAGVRDGSHGLLQQADRALYRAKESGRNCVGTPHAGVERPASPTHAADARSITRAA